MRDPEKHRAQSREWYAANKEQRAAYLQANKEKIRADGKAWRQANQEKNRARVREWYAANKDRCAALYQANREKVLARSKARYQANRDEILAQCKKRRESNSQSEAYRAKIKARGAIHRAKRANSGKQAAYDAKRYAADPDKINAWSKRWKAANAEHVSARQAKWRAANPEKQKALRDSWRERNPDRTALSYSRHSAKRRSLLADVGSFSLREWRQLLDQTGHKCLCCGIAEALAIYRFPKKGEPCRGRLTKDHVIPITEGGAGSIDNIQPLCLPCNQRKSNRHIDYRAHHGTDRHRSAAC